MNKLKNLYGLFQLKETQQTQYFTNYNHNIHISQFHKKICLHKFITQTLCIYIQGNYVYLVS